MSSKWIVLAIALFAPDAACALPGAAPQFHELPNGLRIITKEDHSRPLVAVCGYVLGGARTEPAELSGLSHYYEHLIFRGGSKLQREMEMRKEFQRIGRFFGYTTDDATCFYITVPTENLKEGVRRYADALFGFELTPAKVDRERQVVLEEFNMRVNDSPQGRAWHQISSVAFPQHPYGRTVIGQEKVIRGASFETFQTFYKERYAPNQLVLAAVGDFDTAALLALLREHFGGYAPGPLSFDLGVQEPPQQSFREVASEADTELSYLLLGFRIPGMAHPDIPALAMLDEVLGKGKTSRLYQALKVRDNLVQSVETSFDPTRDPSLYIVELQIAPGDEEKAAAAAWEEMRRLAVVTNQPKTIPSLIPKDVLDARNQMRVGYAFEHESFFSQAEALCSWAATSDARLEAAWLDRLAAVDVAAVQRAALRYLAPANCTISLVRQKGSAPLSFKKLAADVQLKWPGEDVASVRGEPARLVDLGNGGVSVLKSDPAAQTQALRLLFRGGLWIEPEGKAGIGEFTARMLLRGTETYSASDVMRQIESRGGRIESGCARDCAWITLEGDPVNFDKIYSALALMLTEPTFPPEEIEKVRTDLLREIEAREDDSFALTQLHFFHGLYGDHPYGRPLIGERETIQSITRDDLVAHWRRSYAGANMVGAFVGGLAAAEAEPWMKDHLGELPHGQRLEFPITAPTPAAGGERLVERDRQQTTFDLGTPGLAASDPDFLRLTMAARVIGSRLFFKYVYEEGMAYRMWTMLQPGLAAMPFTFEMGVAPEKTDTALQGIRTELARFLAEPVSTEEFARARGDMIQRFLLQQETNAQRAELYAQYQLLGLGLDFVDRYTERVAALDEKSVRAVAAKTLHPEALTLAAVGKKNPAVAGSTTAGP